MLVFLLFLSAFFAATNARVSTSSNCAASGRVVADSGTCYQYGQSRNMLGGRGKSVPGMGYVTYRTTQHGWPKGCVRHVYWENYAIKFGGVFYNQVGSTSRGSVTVQSSSRRKDYVLTVCMPKGSSSGGSSDATIFTHKHKGTSCNGNLKPITGTATCTLAAKYDCYRGNSCMNTNVQTTYAGNMADGCVKDGNTFRFNRNRGNASKSYYLVCEGKTSTTSGGYSRFKHYADMGWGGLKGKINGRRAELEQSVMRRLYEEIQDSYDEIEDDDNDDNDEMDIEDLEDLLGVFGEEIENEQDDTPEDDFPVSSPQDDIPW